MNRKSLHARQAVVVLAMVAIAAGNLRCGEDSPLAPPTRDSNEVWITATGYEPATLTVPVGTRVKWTNRDTKPQCVESGKPGMPTDLFTSPTILPGETWTSARPDGTPLVFNSAGTIDYTCKLTGLVGRIVVQ